jgi:hypothetical protein
MTNLMLAECGDNPAVRAYWRHDNFSWFAKSVTLQRNIFEFWPRSISMAQGLDATASSA